jgi:hypothetical protein
LGTGWWLASDGKWYSPEQHPDAIAAAEQPTDYPTAPAADDEVEGSSAWADAPAHEAQAVPKATAIDRSIQEKAQHETPPLKGWWMASDGNWYPPELHADPDYRAAEGVQTTAPAAGSDFGIPADNLLARLTGGAIPGGAPSEGLPQTEPGWPASDTFTARGAGQPVFRPPVGGPVSAVPPALAWDSDTFAVLPGKPRSSRGGSGKPRSLLTTVLFFVVLLVVVGAAVVLILSIHHHLL